METRTCQNCNKGFDIEADDFVFYGKMGVPAPTFCPQCRIVRKMADTNERVLYWRKCDLTGKQILSMYPSNAAFPVYDTESWYGDGWDAYDYGMDYDFSKPFFTQYKELLNKVPKMALVKQGTPINSEYTHRVHGPKNSYMVFRATLSEDNCYCYVMNEARDCSDCFNITKCELCYECIDCENCYKLIYGQECEGCRDSYFLQGCYNCSHCVGCVNLRNKEFCIFNKQYSKEDYYKKLEEMALNTYSGLEKMKEDFKDFRKTQPQRSMVSLKANDVSGNWISNCQNVKYSYGCDNVKDGKYLFFVFNSEDVMDFFEWGNKAELVYESENCGINIQKLAFCTQCWMGSNDLTYCDSCPGASHCFGCIGLKKGEYSILNKKYSKEEYEVMIEKIKNQMMEMPYVDKRGIEYKFGEYFPNEISVFSYNETAAIDFYPLTKEEAIVKGYKWRDREKKEYPVTIDSSELPETITETPDNIIQEVIVCKEKNNPASVGAYKISDQELLIYRKLNVPLPHECFDVRHTKRLMRRPSLNLINRNCARCNKEVKTVYTQDYAPLLYCEECYIQEVM